MKTTIEHFLKGTEYCDCNNPGIRELAYQITRHCDNQRDQAVAIFYWVRDNIKYRLGFWNMKASETLEEGTGTCTNKANLFVALLRVCGIPAGYGIMKVSGQDYFGPVGIPLVTRNFKNHSTHIYAGVYLDGRWIHVDPSDDFELSDNMQHLSYTCEMVDWNGISDAKLNLQEDHIVQDTFPIADIEHVMQKKPRVPSPVPYKSANDVLLFFRKEGKNITPSDNYEPLFMKHYRRNHTRDYLALLLFNYKQDMKTKFNNFVVACNAVYDRILLSYKPGLESKIKREYNG
ncbi:MAG: transglutaminase domain-containing protein [bacterium]|nr:transglutaminase domain-containing protein [bacterium]